LAKTIKLLSDYLIWLNIHSPVKVDSIGIADAVFRLSKSNNNVHSLIDCAQAKHGGDRSFIQAKIVVKLQQGQLYGSPTTPI
jgi:hypothetical protein